MTGVVREPGGPEDGKVRFVELFFDLVFVFAITQLSHSLLHHFDLRGLGETTLLMLAVWWIWIYTTWATNFLNTHVTPVRALLFAQMLGGLVLAISIPEAFKERGIVFAGAYVLMHIVRGLFMVWALRANPSWQRNFLRILIWTAVSGVFWIAGGLADGDQRYLLWGLGFAMELAGPPTFFWVPGLGGSKLSDWNISGAHMAERCGLFIIIVLGESLLVTGATFATLNWNALTVGAFLAAFASTVALWWVYFNVGAEHAAHRIERSEDPGRIGRLGYTYLHAIIIAGLILSAVADEFVLTHSLGHAEPLQAFAIVGGPAIFLVGNLAFKRAVFGVYAKSHLTGLGLMAALGLASPWLAPLALSACATLALLVVGLWENQAVKHRKPRPAPAAEAPPHA